MGNVCCASRDFKGQIAYMKPEEQLLEEMSAMKAKEEEMKREIAELKQQNLNVRKVKVSIIEIIVGCRVELGAIAKSKGSRMAKPTLVTCLTINSMVKASIHSLRQIQREESNTWVSSNMESSMETES